MRSALFVATALLPLSGCNFVLPLELERELQMAAPRGAFSATETIDLSAEEAIWSRRDDVRSVDVTEVEIAIVAVGPENRAESADVALGFRPDGAPEDGSGDLHIATLRDVALLPGASTTASVDAAALEEDMLRVLHGSGRFGLSVEASAGHVLDVTVRLVIRGSVRLRVE